jgi:tRNA threonylcarbamoyladenosine biosynthesis protein TsaE
MIESSGSVEETQALGERLGRVLGAGDVVLLEGTLGAGKTAFVQGLARGLDVPADRRVASPTFTLVNEHFGRVPLHHVDLYRIEDPRELDEIGILEYLEGQGVTVVEWAERLGRLTPARRIDVKIEITGEQTRTIEIRGMERLP